MRASRRLRLFLSALGALQLFALEARAQSAARIAGRVLDTAEAPVVGAQVRLEPGARTVVSSREGEFNFFGVTAGVYELRVTRIGYQPVAIPLSVGSTDTTVTVRLVPNPTLLDEVRVRERRAQLSYTAIVVDDDGAPVVDAEVLAAGVSAKLRTDENGHVVVPNVARGTLMVRVRKIGYAAYLGSVTIEAEREDTLRMPRLPTSLERRLVLARSGFGEDTFAFLELHSRQSWKTTDAGTISREELAAFGDEDLCAAIPRTRTGALRGVRASLDRGTWCTEPTCILINGLDPVMRPLMSFRAREIEAIEYFPGFSDWSGTIYRRTTAICPQRFTGPRRPGRYPGGWVIWLVNDST